VKALPAGGLAVNEAGVIALEALVQKILAADAAAVILTQLALLEPWLVAIWCLGFF
jgi:hypothetical protein